MGAWVYILRCNDGSYYTGLTRSQEPEKRLSEHNIALSPSSFTAKRLPVKLVYAEYFDMVVDAIAAERKIKGWSRAKKEALIAGNWDEVARLTLRGSLRSLLRVRRVCGPHPEEPGAAGPRRVGRVTAIPPPAA